MWFKFPDIYLAVGALKKISTRKLIPPGIEFGSLSVIGPVCVFVCVCVCVCVFVYV